MLTAAPCSSVCTVDAVFVVIDFVEQHDPPLAAVPLALLFFVVLQEAVPSSSQSSFFVAVARAVALPAFTVQQEAFFDVDFSAFSSQRTPAVANPAAQTMASPASMSFFMVFIDVV